MSRNRQTDEMEAALRVLGRHRATLAQFTKALRVINSELPTRFTTRQLLALAMIAEAHSEGRMVTITDLREQGGATKDGSPIIGQAIVKSYPQFQAPTKRDPDALGWVYEDYDEDDRRLKYVRMSDAGEAVFERVAEALEGTK